MNIFHKLKNWIKNKAKDVPYATRRGRPNDDTEHNHYYKNIGCPLINKTSITLEALKAAITLCCHVPVFSRSCRKITELRMESSKFAGTVTRVPSNTRNATRLVASAIVASLGALTHTLGTFVPMIGASGFAKVAAATAIGTVVGSFR
ncbi:hypothetical protein TEA_017712 [Camellia sinensis var. sinensis]|uniref:Uncharacterized protein n=1 Tax=Camellia sinensis var. sinensis TaxID=542762 RepID=A0A4S4EAY6_CAMSN|nr:hypothetical protein TEA_017712 [Camellia sinensis var. sinensis]